MAAPLCEQYGFDSKTIRKRLSLLGLDEAECERHRKCAEMLQRQVIGPRASAIVDRFYEFLTAHEEFRAILEAAATPIDDLKRTQTAYLRSLGVDFDRIEYFEERLRVGEAHARVRLPLSLYQCAYRLLQQLIIDHIPETLKRDQGVYDALIGFILKVTALDMSLAIETYYLSNIHVLEASLDAIRDEDARLRRRIDTDALTQLASHEYGMRALRRALNNYYVHKIPLCVVMGDLDRFKEVNDNFGHLVGDKVLRDVGARMKSGVRDFDTVARYGGEEFVIVLANTRLQRAREIAERVRQRVRQTPIHVDGHRVPMTISQGIACARPGDDVESLIGRADKALYKAKEAGRDSVEVIE